MTRDSYLKLADEAAASLTPFGWETPSARELVRRLKQAVQELVRENERLRKRLEGMTGHDGPLADEDSV